MARKKRNKPAKPVKGLDPAELARIAAQTRRNPAQWGPNDAAFALVQNEAVKIEAETRTKTQRITRYDCFALLASRGALGEGYDENRARVAAVRRFEEKLAEQMRLEGTTGTSSDGSRAIPISDRSLYARQCIDFLCGQMSAGTFSLLKALVTPSVQDGQPVNNWRALVQKHTGEHYHTAQASMVRATAHDLLNAWQNWDQRERRAA